MTNIYRDSTDLGRDLDDRDDDERPERRRPAPGKRTRTLTMSSSEARMVMRKAASGTGLSADGTIADGSMGLLERASTSSGAPLRADLRERFEASLGTDLTGVRVHVGDASATASTAIGARAYTVGKDIHFAAGQYAPDDAFGLHLLAHEVAHTAQQAGGSPVTQTKLAVSHAGDSAEVEADRAADAMVGGHAFRVSAGPAHHIQRDPDPAAKPKTKVPVLQKGAYAFGATGDGGKVIWVNKDEAATWSTPSRMVWDIFCRRYFPTATADQIAQSYAELGIWSGPSVAEPGDTSVGWKVSAKDLDGMVTWMEGVGVASTAKLGTQDSSPADAQSPPGVVGLSGGTGKPGQLDKVTAERTIGQVKELFEYLQKNYPDHPIFKNKKATLQDLVEYLALQESGEKGKFDGISLMEQDATRLNRFLDKWERGDQLYAPITDPTKAPSGVSSMEWVPAGAIAVDPETNGGLYATGNWLVFRVAFNRNDENHLINVEPNRANFAWDVVGKGQTDPKGKEIAAGTKAGTSHNAPLPSASATWAMDLRAAPNGPGQIEYRLELKQPGAYAVGCSVSSSHFIGGQFSPERRNIIVRDAAERQAEVFDDHLDKAAESPFRKNADDDWEARKGTRPMTLADRLAAAESRKELLLAAKAEGKFDAGALDAALEKADDEIKKLKELDTARVAEAGTPGSADAGTEEPYLIHGAFFDEVRGSNGPIKLTAYGIRRSGTDDGKTFDTLTFVMIESTLGKYDKYTAIVTGEGEQLERTAIAGAISNFQGGNRLPDGTAKIVVTLHSTGAPAEFSTSTKNANKTVKEAAGNALKWGTVVVCSLTVVGSELALTAGAIVSIIGAAGTAADVRQRVQSDTFGDDVGQEALDLVDLAASVLPMGASKIKAPAGWMAVGLTGMDKGQDIIFGARTYKEIEDIKAAYAAKMLEPKADRAKLEQEMKEQIAGALSNAIQTGTLMMVMRGANNHKKAQPHPSATSKWKGRVSENLSSFAGKATELEIRDKLNTDGKRLTRFEREFLEDCLRFHETGRNRAAADEAAEKAAKPDEPAPDGAAAKPSPDGAAAKPAPDGAVAKPAPDGAAKPPAAAAKPPEASSEGLIGTLEKQQALPEQHAHADGSVPTNSVMAEPDGLAADARARQITDLREMITEVKQARDQTLADLRSGKRRQDGEKVSSGDRVDLTKGADALTKEGGLLDRLLAAKEKLQQAEQAGEPAEARKVLRATVVSAVAEYQSHLAMRKPDYAVYTEDVTTGVEFFRRYKMIMGHELSPREIADARASGGQLASQELRVGFDGTDLAPVREMATEFNNAHDKAAWDGDYKDVSLVLNTTKNKTASNDPGKNQNQAMGQFVDEWMKGGEMRKAFSGMDNAGVENAGKDPALMWEAAAKRAFGNAKLVRETVMKEVPADQRAALATCLARTRGSDASGAAQALERFLARDLDAALAEVATRAEAGRGNVGKDLPDMAASTVNQKFAGTTMEEVAVETRQLFDALRAMRAETGDRRALPDQLGLTVHAGEQLRTVDPFVLLNQCEQTISLGADRIGHGLILSIDPAKLVEMGRLSKDQVADFTARQIEVREHARRAGVVIEMNMTSNTEISNLKGSEHPAGTMVVEHDLRVTASTDDETVLRTTVADELRRLAAAPGITRADIAEVVLEGFFSRLGGRELRDRGRLKRQYREALTAGLSVPEVNGLANALAKRFNVAPVEGDANATLSRVLDTVFGVGGHDFNPTEL